MGLKLFQCTIYPHFHYTIGLSLKILARGSFLANFPASCLSSCKFYTTGSIEKAIQGFPISQPIKTLQREKSKKAQKWKDNLKGKRYSAVAYSSAARYRISNLIKGLANQDLYEYLPLPEDAAENIHLQVKTESTGSPSHIYLFSEGSVVFWNISESKRKDFLNFLKPYEIHSYNSALIDEEKEDLDYVYSEHATRFNNGLIILNSKTNTDLYTYTFSNSLAQSVKLGILEATLECFSDSIKCLADKMKSGEKIKMSKSELYVKRGELAYLRHIINLSSDFLDTPDFYWDREDLEILYVQACRCLDISKRTKALNKKLNYCSELVDLQAYRKTDEHHVRQEWMIIILIMIQVLFESVDFFERLAG